MSIEYYCISYLSVTNKYRWRYTSWNSISNKQDKSANFLDRHTIACGNDEAVSQFRMEVSGNSIRFRFRCNKIHAVSLHHRATGWERFDLGQIYMLKKHYLFGKSKTDKYNVLRGWRMHTKYTNQWCTFMCDKFQDMYFDIWYATLKDYKEHM